MKVFTAACYRNPDSAKPSALMSGRSRPAFLLFLVFPRNKVQSTESAAVDVMMEAEDETVRIDLHLVHFL